MVAVDVHRGTDPEADGLSVRQELERKFARRNRQRTIRGVRSGLALLVLAVGGFWVWSFAQYRTLAWWSAPTRIPYCGIGYVRAQGPVETTVHRSWLGPLVEV